MAVFTVLPTLQNPVQSGVTPQTPIESGMTPAGFNVMGLVVNAGFLALSAYLWHTKHRTAAVIVALPAVIRTPFLLYGLSKGERG